MKRFLSVLALLLWPFWLQAASVRGDITLPYSLSKTNTIALTDECGETVKTTWSCRVSEYYGWETIFAQVTVNNIGSKPMWVQSGLAFYDKDRNLIATTTQSFLSRSGLKRRTSKTLSPCRMVLPKDRYKDIVSYEVVVNELSTPPSKKKETILLEDP